MVATVINLTAASATVHYFERDGYYAKGDPAHRKASFWHGGLGSGLGRHVSPKNFHSVLEGFVPGTDLRLGRVRGGGHQHRPGVDLTLSAPKSVSLAALVQGDRRVIRAHDQAVRATLDHVEAEWLQTRGYDPQTGRRPRIKAHGMLAAGFRHLASRNLDPQLHTHCVIANMTRNASGEWRSIEPWVLHRTKKLIGAYYRSELASRLRDLGYEIAPSMVGPVPGFEIAGYDRSVLAAFSTRRRDILEDLKRRGVAYSPARAQQAALYTRARKAERSKEELRAIWRARAAEIGLDPEAHVRLAGQARREMRLRASQGCSALDAVRRAAEHLEERASVFAESDLMAFALGLEPGRLGLAEITSAIGDLKRSGHLVEARLRRAERAYVTDRALRAERRIVGWMKESSGEALARQEEVAARLAGSGLTEGQREALETILLTPARVVGVQGYAGTGKTEMLGVLAGLAGGRRVIGLAPSVRAAQTLADRSGIPTRTLQWFLRRYRDAGADGPERLARARERFAGGIVVVDEASMVSTEQMRSLMLTTERLGVARLALVGDRRQLRPIGAGQPFRQLQEAGMATAVMDDIRRQRDPDLKAAVAAMLSGEPRRAVAGLDVSEVAADELGETAARLWLDLDAEAREGTEVLAPTHALREDINEAIREGLNDEGVLRGRVLEVERLVSLHLTHVQKADPANYRTGDVVVFNEDIYPYRVEAGDACPVTGIADGRVLMDHPDGRPRRIDPAKPVRYRLDVFETRTIQLQTGDRVRWTRNDKRRGLVNGGKAEILGIGPRQVRLKTEDGRTLCFSRADPQLRHLDHAYSSTVHGAQSITADNVIAVLDSGGMADQSMFYVEISRARDNVALLTDNLDDLVERLEADTGKQMTALEAVGESLEEIGEKPAFRVIVAEEREDQRAAARKTARPSPRPEETVAPRAPGSGDLYAAFRRDWRAHHEGAKSAGAHPFYHPGYSGLAGRMRELAARDDLEERMRAALAGAMESHDRLEGGRAEIRDWLAEAGREVKEEGEDIARARTRAERLVERGRAILGDPDRHAVHLAQVRHGLRLVRDGIKVREEWLEAINRQLGLSEDWKRHCRRAAEAGRDPLSFEGIQSIATRLEDHARQGAPPMPDELQRVIDGYRALTAVAGALPALKTALEDRRRRLREAQGEALTSLPAYKGWREAADNALSGGREVLADEERHGVHLDRLRSGRKRIAAALGKLEKALEADELAAGILRDGDARDPAMYRDLAARARELSRRAAGTGGVPKAVSRVVREHRALAGARAEVDKLVTAVTATAERGRLLLHKAGDRTPVSTGAWRGWRKGAEEVSDKAREILRDRGRYGPVIGEGERARIEGLVREVGRARLFETLPARFILDWEAYVAQAGGRSSRFDESGYQAFAKRMEGLANRYDLNRSAARMIQDEVEAYRQDRGNAGRIDAALKALGTCLENRGNQLARAAEAGVPVTDLPDYRSWRLGAERTHSEIDDVLLNRSEYGRHLARIPGAEDRLRDGRRELARIWKADEEPYRASEQKRAAERQRKIQERSQGGGISF